MYLKVRPPTALLVICDRSSCEIPQMTDDLVLIASSCLCVQTRTPACRSGRMLRVNQIAFGWSFHATAEHWWREDREVCPTDRRHTTLFVIRFPASADGRD